MVLQQAFICLMRGILALLYKSLTQSAEGMTYFVGQNQEKKKAF